MEEFNRAEENEAELESIEDEELVRRPFEMPTASPASYDVGIDLFGFDVLYLLRFSAMSALQARNYSCWAHGRDEVGYVPVASYYSLQDIQSPEYFEGSHSFGLPE